MKLWVCLSFFLVATAAQEQKSIFDMVEETLRNGNEVLKNFVYESVIEVDGSAYKPDIQTVFRVALEPQFCPSDSLQNCQKDTSWLFDCKCRKTFAALGECGAVPCRVLHWIKNTGPEALSKFVNADSYEKKAQVFNDYLVTPLANILCGCTSVFKASAKCIKNYDGKIFDYYTEFDRSKFDNMVKTVDWKAAHGILESLFDVGCGEDREKNCTQQIGELYMAFGTFLDNTVSGRDTCVSSVRMEAEFTAFVLSFIRRENQDIDDYLQGMADAYVNHKLKMMCDGTCADEIQNNFYNGCCLKRGTELFTSAGMRKKYGKFAKSIVQLFGAEGLVNVKKFLKKIVSVLDFEGFCGDRVAAYRNFNEHCNAIRA